MKDANWRFDLLYPFRVWEDVEPGWEIPPTRPDLPQSCMVHIFVPVNDEGTMTSYPVVKPTLPIFSAIHDSQDALHVALALRLASHVQIDVMPLRVIAFTSAVACTGPPSCLNLVKTMTYTQQSQHT